MKKTSTARVVGMQIRLIHSQSSQLVFVSCGITAQVRGASTRSKLAGISETSSAPSQLPRELYLCDKSKVNFKSG